MCVYIYIYIYIWVYVYIYIYIYIHIHMRIRVIYVYICRERERERESERERERENDFTDTGNSLLKLGRWGPRRSPPPPLRTRIKVYYMLHVMTYYVFGHFESNECLKLGSGVLRVVPN